MKIWKNTCDKSWQDTIENGWEVSGKPGAFLFFIPKGALTHHLLKQAVAALPLAGLVRSSPGQEPPAAVALRNAPAGAVRGGLRLLRRLPASTCHRQLDTDTGVEQIAPPVLVVRRISRRTCWHQVRPIIGRTYTEEGLLRFTVAFRKDGRQWRFII